MNYLDTIPSCVRDQHIFSKLNVGDKLILIDLYPHLSRCIQFTPEEQSEMNGIINAISYKIGGDVIDFFKNVKGNATILKLVPIANTNVYVVPSVIVDDMFEKMNLDIYGTLFNSQKWKNYFNVNEKGQIYMGDRYRNLLNVNTREIESVIRKDFFQHSIQYNYSNTQIALFLRYIKNS